MKPQPFTDDDKNVFIKMLGWETMFIPEQLWPEKNYIEWIRIPDGTLFRDVAKELLCRVEEFNPEEYFSKILATLTMNQHESLCGYLGQLELLGNAYESQDYLWFEKNKNIVLHYMATGVCT